MVLYETLQILKETFSWVHVNECLYIQSMVSHRLHCTDHHKKLFYTLHWYVDDYTAYDWLMMTQFLHLIGSKHDHESLLNPCLVLDSPNPAL